MVLQAEEGVLTTSSPRVLVATAVPAERDAVARAFSGAGTKAGAGTGLEGLTEIRLPGAAVCRAAAGWDLLAAGVGPARAAASAAAALTAAALDGTPYDLVVSAGIGGGFAPHAPVGSLVVADAITVADLGAETADGFLAVTELGFGTVTHRTPESLVRVASAATGARTGPILTVSTVTGTAARADALRARHPGALAEGMEGFGIAEAAAAHGVPVLEIRAISNPVGPRDRAAWRIGDALTALTAAFGNLAPVLESWNAHDAHDAHDR
ncbi:futalosine hydrolase [Streptomyces broussonetiae]|uniref:Futalosine hydrolase n=1 Tax=Streptomyces broussonetiae TaxID=2686304 RepID=A0A6I6N4S0_9ACTN|nr:futalosine hydrolase [Streptomyces broussonetiae]QHA05411.1 futalosine hydrolase [Streptomyces broussonetiae]